MLANRTSSTGRTLPICVYRTQFPLEIRVREMGHEKVNKRHHRLQSKADASNKNAGLKWSIEWLCLFDVHHEGSRMGHLGEKLIFAEELTLSAQFRGGFAHLFEFIGYFERLS